MADHTVRSVWAQVEQRARLEVPRLPPAPDSLFVKILARAGRHRRPRRHRAPAFELHPDRLDGPVVVESQTLASLAVHDKEEGALLAAGPEAARAQRRHEPRHARQHLMRLRQIDGGAGGEGALNLAARGSAVVLALGRDLDG